MSEFDKFIGIPYEDKGRGPNYDCWGLFALVFREIKGVELPSYSDRYVTAQDRVAIDALIAGELSPWEEIEQGLERPLDGVLLKEAGRIRHVGIVTKPGMLLHVQRGETSQIERYRSGPLKYRIVGFYRYRDQ